MAKKQAQDKPINNRTILKNNSTEYLNKSSLEYSIYTLSRQITGIDGLKSAQRKVIYALSKVNGKIKTMSLSGKMIEMEIYVHGDTSANDTSSGMASPVDNNYPLIEGHGSFGTIANPKWAAARYTYLSAGKNTTNLLYPDLNIIPMKDNYDGSTQEPVHFLPIIPLSLLGTSGLAVGYSATILPRKITDVIKNCIKAIDGKEQTDMIPYFRSYGCNDKIDNPEPKKYVVHGKAEIIDASSVRITGLPVKQSLEKFTEKLISMVDSGEIRDYDDSSTDDIDITIKLPRGTSAKWTETDALEFFKLSSKLSELITVLDENENVKVYDTPAALINDFIKFRFSYYVKRYQKLLDDANKDALYNILIKSCFDNDMSGKVRTFKNKKELTDFIRSLNVEIGADESCIDKIAGFPIYRWVNEYKDQVESTINTLIESINEYNTILSTDDNIWKIYRNELEELLKLYKE